MSNPETIHGTTESFECHLESDQCSKLTCELTEAELVANNVASIDWHIRFSLLVVAFKDAFFELGYFEPLVAGVSLHLEPREDRRHAYQWHVPSGDPTRATSGGMIGANRLALEAWPLFQSLPSGDKLVTVGFRGLKAYNTRLYWPIWSKPVDLDTVRSLLSLRTLDSAEDSEIAGMQARGIEVVYLCRRILVGKTPNLTAPEPMFAK